MLHVQPCQQQQLSKALILTLTLTLYPNSNRNRNPNPNPERVVCMYTLIDLITLLPNPNPNCQCTEKEISPFTHFMFCNVFIVMKFRGKEESDKAVLTSLSPAVHEICSSIFMYVPLCVSTPIIVYTHVWLQHLSKISRPCFTPHHIASYLENYYPLY